MIERSYDPEVMQKAFEPHTRYHDAQMNYDAWVKDTRNVMFAVENGDIGLATFEYPGVYGVHWFFNHTKGRAAIRLAQDMLDELFTNYEAKTVRGLTPIDIKAARILAKYVGFKSYGLIECPETDGPNRGICELMLMTKNGFYEHLNKGKTDGS
jgi:hypothetical protein